MRCAATNGRIGRSNKVRAARGTTRARPPRDCRNRRVRWWPWRSAPARTCGRHPGRHFSSSSSAGGPSVNRRARQASMRLCFSASMAVLRERTSSAASMGPVSMSRMSLPMYCRCRASPPRLVMRLASRMASISSSGQAERGDVGFLERRSAVCRDPARRWPRACGRSCWGVRIPASSSSCIVQFCHASTRSTPARQEVDGTRIPELKNIVADALRQARELGATQAEADVSLQKGLTTTVRLGEVETVEYQRDRGMGITVYFGKRKGSASTADLSPRAVAETVEKACDIARYTAEDDCSGLADPRRAGARDSGPRSRPSLGDVTRGGGRDARALAKPPAATSTRASPIPKGPLLAATGACACTATRMASSPAIPPPATA